MHRFLAGFPRALEEAGLERHHQLILTTNLDDALERAFDEAGEPYDLAVYIASGYDKGRFVHIPWDEPPEVIADPTTYHAFPVDDLGDLRWTVIVKAHGGVAGGDGDHRWRDNYVITADDFDDYLSGGSVEELVPVQIRFKLRDGHCLFLGCAARDRCLTVLLRRFWSGMPLRVRSWAVEPGADESEELFWNRYQIQLCSAELADYAERLSEQLVGRIDRL